MTKIIAKTKFGGSIVKQVVITVGLVAVTPLALALVAMIGGICMVLFTAFISFMVVAAALVWVAFVIFHALFIEASIDDGFKVRITTSEDSE